MEEISSTVKNTADHVRDAAQVASGNSLAATRGGVVIAQVIHARQNIDASSRKTGDIIGTSLEQTAATAAVLKDQATGLASEVDRFKLPAFA